MTSGIYIHIPFCVRKCHYCDFFSITDRSLIPAFISHLLHEIALQPPLSIDVDSVYFGGGTPSLLEPKDIADILDAVRSRFPLTDDVEITIEANPKTIDYEKLLEYRHIGINRINIGIQSFQDHLLKILGRIHTSLDAIHIIEWAKKAGFENVGVDLIYGIPNQTIANWLSDLKQTVALHPEHISCYLLTHEPGTVLTHLIQTKAILPLNEPIIERLFITTIDYLTNIGFRQYEISNYAKTVMYRSCHNQKYWHFQPYLGLGPSAHSFFGITRYWNHRSVTDYMKDIDNRKLPICGKETLSIEQQIIEAVYLGLRTVEGVSVKKFQQRFGKNFRSLFKSTLDLLISEGLMDTNSIRVWLTRKGMKYLDSIVSMLINHLDDGFHT